MKDQNQTIRSRWHQRSVQEVLSTLQVTTEQGLTTSQAQQRLAEYGPNEIIDQGGRSIWKMLWAQLTDTMVLVLLAAAVISGLIGDWKDAIAIFAIVLINAIIGLVQEYRAEQAMAALKQMASPTIRVQRNGKPEEIDAKYLVPGDIIFLEAGSKVPADARLIMTANLRVEEASLTGESEPVDKTTQPLDEEDITLGDRTNMLYMGTTVVFGRGTAAVVQTGMQTELGRIAEMIQTVEEDQTPLQKRMDRMGKTLAVVALGIVAVVFVLGLLRGEEPSEMFLTSVAMAVAAVPEGLPAVVAIALALGAQRMLKRQALIRKLPAVETLGSVTVIASDKTGTLTANQMQLRVLDVAGNTQELDWQPGHPAAPEFNNLNPATKLLLLGGVLNNDAQLVTDDREAEAYLVLGDPTEGALISAAANLGLIQSRLAEVFPRVGEIPFSSERKRMTTLHQPSGNYQDFLPEISLEQTAGKMELLSFTKGAVDGLLEISSQVFVNGKILPLDQEWKSRIEQATDSMAKDGLRVLGLGFEAIPEGLNGNVSEVAEKSLVFVGLFGMMDPPRPEAFESVQTNNEAGIRTIMITGDHPLTAQRIARDLGIEQNSAPITGKQLQNMSDQELRKSVSEVNVYARVAPEHKLRIVTALQDLGEVVAMTGDGVNDAPALRKADIGVAMGITGTDVSKEAADMVLLDDNFATIVRAVREGRTIFDNIRKFIKYTMTSNAGEVLVMLLAPLFGLPLPLTALQILWINLVTDGLPGLALSVEPTEKDTMKRPPIDIKKSIFSGGLSTHIIWVGLLMGIVSLGVGFWGWQTGNPYWKTMVFTTLTLSQMGHALAVRSDKRSLFSQGLFSNKLMVGAVMLTFGLQMIITYWTPMNEIFKTQPLPLQELAISLGFSLVVFFGVELEKWFKRRNQK
ncbi:MAG: cation-translocating P-type ATPase [Anaerolineales bacterium]|nr:cation-translocating P-type ATPase [Anaerolineales bacterium]